MPEIYLDYSATTPVRPEVVEAMLPFLGSSFGNPSSIHFYGQQAKAALDSSRDILANAIGAEPSEITFTGSGTEADNLALVGTVLANPTTRRHIITSAIEHDAVLKTTEFLRSLGCEITVLPVGQDGIISPQDVKEALRDNTSVVSIMHANNEVGSIQQIAEISAIVHENGSLMHTDAVQSFGQLNVNVDALDVDLMSLSAHKIYGPKGVGALYIRRGTPMIAEIYGGGQERGRRSGTENVAGIAGFAKAVSLLLTERSSSSGRLTNLRDHFIHRVISELPGSSLNGPTGSRRLPNNINLSFENIEGEALLLNLDIAGIAASSGSACSSGSIEPSHVLIAMGVGSDRSRGAIRLSLGRSTSKEDLDTTFDVLSDATSRLRSMSSHSISRLQSGENFTVEGTN